MSSARCADSFRIWNGCSSARTLAWPHLCLARTGLRVVFSNCETSLCARCASTGRMYVVESSVAAMPFFTLSRRFYSNRSNPQILVRTALIWQIHCTHPTDGTNSATCSCKHLCFIFLCWSSCMSVRTEFLNSGMCGRTAVPVAGQARFPYRTALRPAGL